MDVALATLVNEAFNGKTPTKARIIQALDTVREFNRLETKRQRDAEFGPAYDARMAVATSLSELFRGFKILLPVTKYRLQVDKLKIEGEYAVLQEKHKRGPVAFLHLRADDFSSDEGARPPTSFPTSAIGTSTTPTGCRTTPAIVS